MSDTLGGQFFGPQASGSLRKIIIIVGVACCTYTVWLTLTLRSNVSEVSALKRSLLGDGTENDGHIAVGAGSRATPTMPQPLASDSTKSRTVSSSTPAAATPWGHLQDISVAYAKKWVGFPGIAGNDCHRAFNASTKSNSIYPKTVGRIFPEQLAEESADCDVFIQKYGWQRYPQSSEEEKNFPIAFVILFYKDLDQVLFLLRAVYRPHNVYCLSIDTKASIDFLNAVRSVAKCLPNVFVARKLEHIVYSGFSRLMADIDCMGELLDHPVQWKYVFNLPGQQFPLRTNLELVRILKLYNGANDVEGLTGDRMVSTRFKFKHRYETDTKTGEVKLVRTTERNKPPPHKLKMVKGSAYGTFSRAFVQFVVQTPMVKDFLDWIKNVCSPDEYFWATLHHSKIMGAPGGFVADKPEAKPWLSAYASWGGRDPCATIRTRSVCIFSPEDLPVMMERPELFANKFYITHHPAALHCLDELLFNQTFTGETRDLSFYRNLPFALKSNTSSAIGG